MPFAKCDRNAAAVQEPPSRRSFELTRSAVSPRISLRNSGQSGIRHSRSPLASPAAWSSAASASSAENSPAECRPSAIDIAPVSVARSTTAAGANRRAWTSASASSSRPSASVLVTSPGFTARLPIAFSALGMRPTSRNGSASASSEANTPITAAAPLMSYFILFMPSRGLSETPPVSNVTPLPISTSAGTLAPRRAPAGSFTSSMKRGGCGLPRPTASTQPMPSRSIAAGSWMVARAPTRRATSRARSASAAGGRSWPGVLARSRARATASPRVTPAASAARAAAVGGWSASSSTAESGALPPPVK